MKGAYLALVQKPVYMVEGDGTLHDIDVAVRRWFGVQSANDKPQSTIDQLIASGAILSYHREYHPTDIHRTIVTVETASAIYKCSWMTNEWAVLLAATGHIKKEAK